MLSMIPDSASLLANALESSRLEVRARLTEIQAELDAIGSTFGMQPRRSELNRAKNDLLDQLLALRALPA